MIDKQIYDDIHSAFINYLNTYFIKRDLSETVKMFSQQISGFGTGLDEKAYNSNEFQKLYSRDIAQAPNTVQYKIDKLHITTPVKGAGIVSCELNIETVILEQTLSFNNLRLSVFFRKRL